VSDRGAAQATFRGAGDRTIAWEAIVPPEEPARSVVLVAHGYGEHRGRYGHVAARLSRDGHAVYLVDHHGHGHSSGPRARVSFADAVADVQHLAEIASRDHPGVAIFLLGHSMGGAIALRHALAHGEQLSGLILSGPLAEIEGRPAARLAGRALGRLAPGLPVARLDPGLISRDPAVVEAYRADPLVHHGGIPAATAAEFLRHTSTLPDALPLITTPTLLMWGTQDRLAAPSGAEMIARRIATDDLTVRPWDGLYHEIFNEPEREQVLDALCEWLAARTPTIGAARISAPGTG
jgi:alpha-beta hydrolase superfamily lysophospholipase